MLKQKHKVVVPSVGEDYDFDREKFFDDWASTLIHNDGHKFLVCGHILYSLGREANALTCYQKASEIFEELGDKLGVANSCGQLGALYMAQNNYKDAIGYLHRAAAIFEELNSPNLHLTVRYLDSARRAIGENRFNEYLREAGKGN